MLNKQMLDVPLASLDMLQLFEYTGTSLTYHGVAKPGTATSAARWQIKKYTYDGNGNVTSIKFADGTNDYVAVWDNRAGYTYS